MGLLAHAPVPPVVAAGIITAIATAYALAERARARPRSTRAAHLRRRRELLFGLGVVTIVVAQYGPAGTYADSYFWAHMIQHLLLVSLAAPLLAIAAPWMTMLGALPVHVRRRLLARRRRGHAGALRRTAAAMTSPVAVWIGFNAVLVMWHVPAAFGLTLRDERVHGLEHLSFLIAAVWFWAKLLAAPLVRSGMTPLGAAVYAFGASLVGWGLALVLTFAPSPLYREYASVRPPGVGLSALADQRIAASIMLVPGSLAFTGAGAVFFYRWLAGDRRWDGVA